MKKVISIIFVFIFIAAGGFALSQALDKPEPIHIHAGFQVYKDEKLQDFSDFKYMHELPCTVNGKPVEGAKVDEQKEKAHLHDQTGDVVHVHRKGARWSDLFTNINYTIDKNAAVYINGKKIDKFLEREIQPYESVVIFLGKTKDEQKYLKDAVKKDYIEKVENKSETCSS